MNSHANTIIKKKNFPKQKRLYFTIILPNLKKKYKMYI